MLLFRALCPNFNLQANITRKRVLATRQDLNKIEKNKNRRTVDNFGRLVKTSGQYFGLQQNK
jgi:hypothetical protein